MSVAIPFVNDVFHISRERMSDLLQGKDVYQFSRFEKFIDYFRHIFTGKSAISEYYQIHHLLYQHRNHPEISRPMSLEIMPQGSDVTQWRPIIGFVKLIDNSKPEAVSRYSIEVQQRDDGVAVIDMKFDGIVLAQADCSADNLEFLKTCLFNDNNGEIRSRTVDTGFEGSGEAHFYSAFQHRLEKHLSTYVEDLTHFNTRVSELVAMRDEADSSAPADIDRFIEKMAAEGNITKESLAKLKPIGSGSYGSVYLFEGKYAVKIPVNSTGNMIDTHSAEHRNAHPERVSHYLNRANRDPDFSRYMQISFDNKKMEVLVSKYINGKVFDTGTDANYERADNLLYERGVYMHDLNVHGNILIKNDELFFVDGDQIVLSQEKRLERRVSVVTEALEQQIRISYEVKLHAAQRSNNLEDIEYYSNLLDEHNDLMNTTVESPRHDNSEVAMEFVSRDSFRMPAREDSFLVKKTIEWSEAKR
ncbi:protein kinase family protein [Yokenella regensburgei]|jgi:hypothetical protein|uniref:hypothetical protein n=2 Tax=Yokenella regensburgei TaxID=158877 RepID=UPI0002422E5A|nr:hypothetical protein [Yokenella regensburgei]EHM45808.1 hypothetical protein HMPREF0880_03854 [Yokenella regensburgei ATCC 43003]